MAEVANKPKLIVFALEYTLLPFWVETHVIPPLKKDWYGNVINATGNKMKYYPEVRKVLDSLQKDGYELAIASGTRATEEANQLLELFDWNRYFKYKEIYPGCKVTHFNQFKKQSGIAFKDMLFFDDEPRNIRELQAHGVVSVPVYEGVTMKDIEKGLKMFACQRNKS